MTTSATIQAEPGLALEGYKGVPEGSYRPMAKVSRMPGERTTLLANADLIDDLEFVVDALYPLRDASIEVVDAIQTLSRVLSDLYQAVRV